MGLFKKRQKYHSPAHSLPPQTSSGRIRRVMLRPSQTQAGHQKQKGPMASHPQPWFKAGFINRQTATAPPVLLQQEEGSNNNTHGSRQWEQPVTFGEQCSHVIWAGDIKDSHQPDPKTHCVHFSCLFNKPILGENFLLINTSFLIQPFSKRKCSREQSRPPIRRHQIS